MMGGGDLMGYGILGEEAIGARIDMAAAGGWMMNGKKRKIVVKTRTSGRFSKEERSN